MTTKDIQQAVSGFKTVAVIGGPLVVRVHEALDESYSNTPHRYFISVDFKFRESDALNVGKLGCFGCTKSEATRDANILAHQLTVMHYAVEAAKSLPDTPTNRITLRRQSEAFDKIASRYTAEFV